MRRSGSQRWRGGAFPLACLLGAILAVPAAASDPRGQASEPALQAVPWTKIAGPTGINTDEVARVRTPDGVLHLAWRRQKPGQEDLVHTAITAAGKLAGSSTIVSGWDAVENPDLLASGGGLRALFGGIRSTDPADPLAGGVATATSNAAGKSWTLGVDRVSASTSPPGPVGADLTAAGVPVVGWAISFALYIHRGLDPSAADENLQTACCAYHPDVATDAATGASFLGWYSNAKGKTGLYVQQIAPSPGPPVHVPDSKIPGGLDQRMAIAARLGAPGVYVAYCTGSPTCKGVRLWRVAGGQTWPRALAAAGARLVNIAPAPEGRLWVMWQGGEDVYAVRSNKAASQFGKVLDVPKPPGGDVVWKVGGEGSLGPLDLVVSVSADLNAGAAHWYTRVLPALSLSGRPSFVSTKTGGRIVLSVADAGDPVVGAKVHAAGRTLTTDARGEAELTVAKGAPVGTLEATATKPGYAPDSFLLKVG